MTPGTYPEHDSDARELMALGVPATFFQPRFPPPPAPRRQLRLTFATPSPKTLHRYAARHSPAALAEQRGYDQGRHNAQTEPRYNYSTPEQWLAWMRGWQRGQREYYSRAPEKERLVWLRIQQLRSQQRQDTRRAR